MATTVDSKPKSSLLRSYIQILEGKLETEERAVYDVIERERPEWVAFFPAALQKARAGILSRLVNAAFRENLFDFAKRQITVRDGKFLRDVKPEEQGQGSELLADLVAEGMNGSEWR